jgi:hypothetical protein
MKIAAKYGLAVTAVVIVWVVARHAFDIGANSSTNLIAPILFNLAQIVAIFLGTVRRKDELNGNLNFKTGLKTGVAISFVYGLTACAVFFIDYLIAGPKLMMTEAGASNRPLWQTAAIAYTGLFIASLIMGLIYSTVVSFFLAKRRSATNE